MYDARDILTYKHLHDKIQFFFFIYPIPIRNLCRTTILKCNWILVHTPFYLQFADIFPRRRKKWCPLATESIYGIVSNAISLSLPVVQTKVFRIATTKAMKRPPIYLGLLLFVSHNTYTHTKHWGNCFDRCENKAQYWWLAHFFVWDLCYSDFVNSHKYSASIYEIRLHSVTIYRRNAKARELPFCVCS